MRSKTRTTCLGTWHKIACGVWRGSGLWGERGTEQFVVAGAVCSNAAAAAPYVVCSSRSVQQRYGSTDKSHVSRSLLDIVVSYQLILLRDC